MKLTFIVTSLLISYNLFSQIPTLDWAKQLVSTGDMFALTMAIDDSGNSYTSGSFQGTEDFDPGAGTFSLSSYSATQENAFITKLDSSGNLVWAKVFLSTFSSIIHSSTTDNLGNIYLTGNFKGTCDFDPDPSTVFYMASTSAYPNAFVCKLNANGELLWVKHTVTTYASSDEIEIDQQGNILTVGHFQTTADFDPGSGVFNMTSTTGSNPDVFVSKLDANGNFMWAKKLGGTQSDIGLSISIDSAGNIFTTGYFFGTADFDPGPSVYNLTCAGTIDGFVSKLDANGNFILAGSIGGTNTVKPKSIVTGSSGKSYVSGSFSGTVDFDPGIGVFNLTSNGGDDLFVVELDTAGNLDWVKTIEGPYSDGCEQAQLDSNGDLYLIGSFRDTVDFDPGPGIYNLTTTTANSSDLYMCKLTNSGAFEWAFGLDVNVSFYGPNLRLDTSNNVYLTGQFNGTVDFDPGITVSNMTSTDDCFILKLNQCALLTPALSISSSEGDTICMGTNVTYTASAINGGSNPSYQWMINGINVGTNSPTHSSASLISGDVIMCELTSSESCVTSANVTSNTISMVVNQPTSGTDNQISCEAFTWIDGNTYTSANNTATYTFTNAQGCDSIVTLNLTFTTLDLSVTNFDPTLTANATGVTYQWVDCQNSFAPIIGETNGSFTATSNGTYAVIVSSNQCSDTSSCIDIATVGIDEPVAEMFSVYPNPTSGKLSVHFPLKNGNVQMRITNILGQVVVNRTFNAEEELIITIDSESGFYVIEIETDKGEILKKSFVKTQ